MKRKNIIILVLAVLLLISLLTACNGAVDITLSFIVDGEVYHTIDTKGDGLITLPTNPTKEGYEFDGWFWDNDIWEREFTANSLLDAPLSGDMSVYAKWIPEELLNEDYTVTFNSMGGSPVGSATVKYGGKINTPSAPTRKNFIFAGWYKDSDCQTVWNFNAHTVAGNITLYAKWTPEQVNPEEYTVTFVTNCDDSAAPLTVSPGSVISAPNVTNEGFSLEGWYTSLDGGSTLDEKWSFVNNKVNGNITLYAKWTAKNLFTATFNTNGGVSIASYKTSLIESSPETYKDFNTFVAWYLDSNFNESARVEFPYALTRDTTFYAKWMVESHTEGLQFTLQLASNSYFVTGYTGGASSIVVPSTYNNVQVTGINARAFEGHSGLTEVYIPNTVTNLGLGAFSECFSLKKVFIDGEGLQLIGSSVFSNCINLEQINLPDSVINIGGEAFFGCIKLKELYLSDQITNIGTNIIRGCNSLEKLTMPGGRTLISLVGDNVENIPKTLRTVAVSPGSTQIITEIFLNSAMIKEIIIPSSVTSIGANAFSGCTSLETLTAPFIGQSRTSNGFLSYYFGGTSYTRNSSLVPSSLKNIRIYGDNYTVPSYALANTGLVNIELAGVTKIESYAFSYTGIKELFIPEEINTIADFVFVGCSELEAFEVSQDNAFFKSVDGVLYSKDGSTLICCPAGKDITSYTVGDDVDNIRNSAFWGTRLNTVTLPFAGMNREASGNEAKFGVIFGSASYEEGVSVNQSGVTYVIPSALRTVNLTDTVSLGEYAFGGLSDLTSITLPENLTDIGASAFQGLSGLTQLIIPDSVENIGERAFQGSSGLTSITIPDGVTSIGSSAFSGCGGLTSIALPFVGKSISATGNGALFGYIFGMDSYTGGTKVTQYFSSGSYLTSYIPTSLSTVTVSGGELNYGAFYNCSMLTSVTIPETVTSIGDYAFYGSSGLTSITIPETVASIGSGAFYGSSGLNGVYISDIAAWCGISFSNSSSNPLSNADNLYLNGGLVTDLVIPGSVTSINAYAFCGCSGLTSITIPDSVTDVGNDTFYGCEGLIKVHISNIAAWCGISFGNSSSNPLFYVKNLYLNDEWVTDLVIPETVTGIGTYAFSGCSALRSITIPDSVTSIGSSAFSDCDGLNSITLPFVGATLSGAGNTHLGYIFGASSYTSNSSYIPVNLKTVIITGGTSIGSSAFYNCTELTSITIPDSVTSIGSSAFQGCSKLTSITIPFVGTSKSAAGSSSLFGYIFGTSSYSGGTKIKQFYASGSSTGYYIPSNLSSVTVSGGELNYGAFYGCSMLTSVTIPETVTFIGERAFSGCSRLTSIHIPEALTSIGSSAFYNCSGLTGVYINDIASWCNISFSGSESNPLYYAKTLYLNGELVTDLVIPDGVTSIGSNAFGGCSGLTSITIPDSVTSIGSYAFSGCSGLTSITIPDSVTSIGSSAFYDCSGLTGVYINDIASWCNISFSDSYSNPLYYAKNLYLNGELVTDLVIPDSVTSIGVAAFYGCTGLTSITIITIPDGVTSIGSSAFYNCSGLTSVNLGSGVTSIGSSAFRGCSGLTSITIPDSVTSIGSSAFRGCSGLTSITIPDSVTSIGDEAFYGCSGLTSVTIGNGVTSIGSYAFYNCRGLTSITIPFVGASKSATGSSALFGYIFGGSSYTGGTQVTQYYSSTGSKSYYIPSSLRSVAVSGGNLKYGAFYGCSMLISVTIGNSVTSIGSSAFYNCRGLTSLILGSSVTQIADLAFYACYKLVEIYNKSKVTIQRGSQLYGSIGYYALNIYTPLSGMSKLTTTEDGYIFCLENLVAYFGKETELTLPEKFEGKDYNIYDYAFYGCSGLTSITIPDSVVTIGSYAFRGCSGLTSIELPFVGASKSATGSSALFGYIFGTSSYSGGTKITQFYASGSSTGYYIPSNLSSVTVSGGELNYGAFYNCSMLTSVNLGSGVTSIGSDAFSGCSRLMGVYINDIASWCNISFSDSYSNPLYYAKNLYLNGELVTDLVIPVGVTGIGDYAFRYCSGLTSITIPDSVTSIGDYAFSGCSGLTSVTIPDSVTSIDSYAFNGCSGLTSVTIGNGVTGIGSSAFSGCSGLTSITIPFAGGSKSATGSSALFGYIFGTSSYTGGTEIKQYYASGSYLTNYYIPSSLRSVTVSGGALYYGAFYNCSMLTSITIPDSVTGIGSYAFNGCSGLPSVTIGNGVTSIGFGAFQGCTGLTSITVVEGNTVYHSEGNCLIETASKTLIAGCKDSVIPTDGSVTSIGSDAFYGCSGLKSITIPDSVMSIGSSAFSGCSGLTSVNLRSSVTSIGSSAFWYCSRLTSITIPDSVTSIGDYAFYGCSGLTSITIPDSVTSIGSSAFYNTAWYNNQPDGFVYAGKVIYKYKGTIPANTSITLLPGTKSITGYAFSGCSWLKSITIPDSVTNIGSSAFYKCSGLTSITIPFVGATLNGISNTHFGYIFGASSSGANSSYVPASLKTVVITGGTGIGSYAFSGCSGLTSITIPDSVTSIGSYAFSGCSGLTSITIPDSVTSIGYYAFDGTAWYNNQPDGLVYAGKVIYKYKGTMPANTSITLLPGTKGIAGSAFEGYTGLKSITIPDSVTSIGYSAFYNCSGLTSFTFADTSTWYRTTSSSYTGGTQTDVTSPSSNATYFKSTYTSYYWYKI